jgi:hypothetical protein
VLSSTVREQQISNKSINNMNKLQDDKCSDKTKTTGEVRMGREVKTKDGREVKPKHSSCLGNEAATEAEDKKIETREDRASSLV